MMAIERARAPFRGLEQADFLRLEQAAYLKGLLRPFKGKGLEDWAGQCVGLRDQLIALATQRILSQAQAYPFSLLGVQLSLQTTGSGTSFLRWRNLDRSRMGVALWQNLLEAPSTPERLLAELYAMEQQRIVLNMQVSLLHSLGRQARECAGKLAAAEAVYLRRLHRPPTRETP